jgi:hypothetical protein
MAMLSNQMVTEVMSHLSMISSQLGSLLTTNTIYFLYRMTLQGLKTGGVNRDDWFHPKSIRPGLTSCGMMLIQHNKDNVRLKHLKPSQSLSSSLSMSSSSSLSSWCLSSFPSLASYYDPYASSPSWLCDNQSISLDPLKGGTASRFLWDQETSQNPW